MTALVDIVNRALQVMGTRTNVTATELANNSSNEAIQANLILTQYRDQLLRMAPWDCGMNTANLAYISSVPGTPENTSAATTLWQKGQPAPPWVYEYQYPVDCLRACWIVPQTNTGFSGAIPITTAVTGQTPTTWTGPAARFRVGVDQFYPVTAAVVSAGGSGYAVGDLITLVGTAQGQVPIGAPVVLQVLTLSGSAVATVAVVNQIQGEATPLGGSYFAPQANPVAQGSTTGAGSGATFNLTFGAQGDQRVILTNQEFAILNYIKQVTDPNVMDPMFIEAWCKILGAGLVFQLSGDKGAANMVIAEANNMIVEARKADGNESLTINDVTPDFIRIRGINFATDFGWSPNSSFEWGGVWPSYL